MNKLFEFDEHIGDWRVLVQSKDIANGAIKSRHIADDAVTGDKIAKETVEGRNIAPDAIDGTKIKGNTVTGRNIGKEAIESKHLAKESITGDEVKDNSVIPGKIGNDAVQTRNIKDRNVTASKIALKSIHPEHLHRSFVPAVIKPFVDDLQNQIDSLEIAGVAVSNEFGNDTHISISQKTLTDAINKIWQKLEDITGDVLNGISMVVTPTFFVSEDGCDVHVSANTVETNGIFEKIQFFVDGEVIFEATDTEYVSFDHYLDIKDTYEYVVMCKAKILGVEYTRQRIVTRYNEFYIGAGSAYADIMDSAHARQLNGTMRHSYDVTFEEGDKLIIVMGASLADGFIRADLNGAEIELTEETVTIDDKEYVVLTSDAWSAGDYNIDING